MDEPNLSIEPFGRCLARAAGLGALLAAAVGAAECGKLLAQGAPRYGDQAWHMVLLGLAFYALVGVALGAVSGATAWILWRRPSFRAAQPSTCAGLGTLFAVAAFVLTPQVGAALLLPAAVLGTLIALVLRELLDWVPILPQARTWVALGVLALAAGAGVFAVHGGSSAGEATSALPGTARTNVLLVTIDTLRADHLGCYGAADAKTPNIDALASESVLFGDATTQANTTGPSHTTMLTGLYPHDHGARHNGTPIAHGVVTLPQLLGAQGYETAAAVSGFTLKQEACGLAPRFQRFDDELIAWRWMPEVAMRLRIFKVAAQIANRHGRGPMRADRPASETVDAALDWLDGRDRGRPFFLWTHFYDPHCPYEPPPPFDRMHDEHHGDPARNWYRMSTPERRELVADPAEVAHMRALYRGEISYTDHQLARLLDRLRADGVYEDTLVILTSDHGEGLGEHGYWFDHGTFLYDTELAVPLLIRLPRAREAGRKVDAQVRLLDLTPTVLEVLGLEIPPDLSGSSLLSTLSEATPRPRPSFAQGELSGELSGYDLDGRKLSLRVAGRKLIWTSDHWLDSVRIDEHRELFDLSADPGETRDLWDDAALGLPGASPPPAAQELPAQLEAWREATTESSQKRELSPEVREALKALGY